MILKKNSIKWGACTLVVIALSAWLFLKKSSTQPNVATYEHIRVSAKNTDQHFFYSGTIAPLNSEAVFSPYNGSIATVHFQYGSAVKKDQMLMTVRSQKIHDDFTQAINEYFKDKNSYMEGKQKQEGNELLFKNGLISRNDFNTESTSFKNTELAYYQAKTALEDILDMAHIDHVKIERLSLNDTQAIHQLLNKKFNDLTIVSPASGIALFPNQDGGDNKKPLESGQAIKNNELLLLIGKHGGVKLNFNIGQMEINRIHEGDQAIVTSPAFPNIQMKAYVSHIAQQAVTQGENTNNPAMFPSQVIVPNIPDEHWRWIRIGMLAKIDIKIKNPKRILIPLQAVTSTDEGFTVDVVESNGLIQARSIQTGSTFQNNVVVLSGLKAGDMIRVKKL